MFVTRSALQIYLAGFAARCRMHGAAAVDEVVAPDAVDLAVLALADTPEPPNDLGGHLRSRATRVGDV